MQAAEMAQILQTMFTATQAVTRVRPYFKCDYYDANGVQSFVMCNSTIPDGNAKCTVVGVASCTLNYQDLNVTGLAPGITMKVCNTDWLKDPEAFYSVAYLNTVPLAPSQYNLPVKEAAALLSIARAVTQKLDPTETRKGLEAAAPIFLSCQDSTATVKPIGIRTATVRWGLYCSSQKNRDGTRNVTGLQVQVENANQLDPSKLHPKLGDALLYPLLRLPNLEYLHLVVRITWRGMRRDTHMVIGSSSE